MRARSFPAKGHEQLPPERRKAVAESLKDLIQVPFKIGSPGSRVIVYEPGGEVED